MKIALPAVPLSFAIVVALASGSVNAVEPANFKLGPFYVAPTVDTSMSYVDNLLRSETDELTTWYSKITPKVQTWLQHDTNTYSLSYQLDNSYYVSSSDDNFTDHQFNLDVHHEFNAKNTLNVFGEFYDGHEERGTGLSEGNTVELIAKPVEYERSTLGGDYTYGSQESRGRVKLAAKTVDYEFQNYRDYTQFRDRAEDTYSGTFYWGVGAKTDILLEVRKIDNDYDSKDYPGFAGGSFDSEELNYLVGWNWDATAKVDGSVKVGAYDREFKSSGRDDESGFQWEVDLTWKPRTYSVFNLTTSRYSRETDGRGDFINTKSYAVAWDHGWNSRASTHLGLLYANDEYISSTNVFGPRDDDRTQVEASFNYAMKRWFDLGVGVRYEKRDSDQSRTVGDRSSFDYTRNLFFVEAKFSL